MQRPDLSHATTELSWRGVWPAITTPFTADDDVDHEFLARHIRWLLDRGCDGIIPLGSLGEGATLQLAEKLEILATAVRAAGDKPVVAAISSLSTGEAVRLAREAKALGCRGLMVLPPYVHQGAWREIRAHFEAILRATDLPAMLYNNPGAYGVDLRPEQIADLAAEFPTVRAVKESSGDARRVTAIRAATQDTLEVLVGLDDMAVEGARAGAVGWVAGLVNALPEESVELFRLARAGQDEEANALYRWFLPLLRLDTVPEFVQLIKLVQQVVGMGDERVRAPRLPLLAADRERVVQMVEQRLAERVPA